MNFRTVQLDPSASVAAVTAALRGAEAGERLLFVLPEQADEFAHEVRLQVLRRQADAAGLRIGLVTEDADVRYHARRARIPAFSSLEQAAKPWRYPRPPAELPPPGSFRPLVISPPADVGRGLKAPEIVTQGGRTLLAGRTQQRKSYWWLTASGYLLLIAIIAALLGGVALALIPGATITLIPDRMRFVSSIAVSARVGIDEADYINLVIPARAVQARVESFGTVETTGTEDAPLGKATGVVTFINQTNRAIEVPSTTVVRTTTGNNNRFRVQGAFTVPAGVGQQITAIIEAVEPGRQGNVPAFTISEVEGPLNLSLRVSNQSATAGGTIESVAVVVQADKDRLLGQLQDESQRQAYARLAEGLQQGEFIPPETVSTFTLAETYDRFAGEPAAVLGLQLQLLARGTAVDLTAAQGLAERSLRQSIPADHFLLEETVRVGQPTFTRFAGDSVDLTLTANGDTLIPIKTADVRSLLAGVPLAEAASLLQQELELAVPPVITLEPNWLDRIPYIPTRITVRVLQE